MRKGHQEKIWETASAKGLGQGRTWQVGGRARRRVWLQWGELAQSREREVPEVSRGQTMQGIGSHGGEFGL